MQASLKKRLLSSAVLVSISVWAIFFGPIFVFVLIVTIIGSIALFEYMKMAEKKGLVIGHTLPVICGAFIPVAAYLGADVFSLIISCLLLFAFHFHPKLRDQAFLGTAVPAFGLFYVTWFFSHLVKLRMLDHGAAWVFYTILIVKGGDAGAYFIGSKYGKHKLIEHISPNKSVEGAIGCFGVTIILSLFSKSYLPHASITDLLLLGVIVGVISQLGDLSESLIKRDVGVKDSGQVPGLGGILDVLDSLLMTIPLVYYYVFKVVQ